MFVPLRGKRMSVAIDTRTNETLDKAAYDAEFDMNALDADTDDDSLGPARMCLASWITPIP